jgi:hypothetical protein
LGVTLEGRPSEKGSPSAEAVPAVAVPVEPFATALLFPLAPAWPTERPSFFARRFFRPCRACGVPDGPRATAADAAEIPAGAAAAGALAMATSTAVPNPSALARKRGGAVGFPKGIVFRVAEGGDRLKIGRARAGYLPAFGPIPGPIMAGPGSEPPMPPPPLPPLPMLPPLPGGGGISHVCVAVSQV